MRIYRKKMPNHQLSPTFYVKAFVNGRLVHRSTGCSEERAARASAKKLLGKLREQSSAKGLVENFRQVLAGGEPVTLDEAFGLFKGKPRRKPIGEKQLAEKLSYWDDFRQFMSDRYPAAKELSQVDVTMAQAYISHVREHGRYDTKIDYSRGPGRRREKVSFTRAAQKLSNRTLNVIQETIQQVFETLTHDAGLLENPFRAIHKLPNEYASREAFTPEELKKIGEKADPFILAIFMVGVNTGLREGDICTLLWTEVDLQGGWIARRMLKTGNTVRIPILPALRAFLETLPRDGEFVLPEHAAMYNDNPSGISYRVRKFLADTLKLEKTRAAEGRTRKVSVRDVHSLRHTFCYTAAINNVPLPIVQSIVGHVDPAITRMYADHVQDAVKKERLAVLPDYLRPSPAPALPPAPTENREQKAIDILSRADDANWRKSIDEALAVLRG